MKDGLFKRYIITFGSTLLTCTLLLGIALLYFSGHNYNATQQELLQKQSERAVAVAAEGYERGEDGDKVSSTVYDGFRNIAEASFVTAYLTDLEGHVIVCSEGAECTHTTKVSERTLNIAIKRGSYSSAGYLEGFFRQKGNYSYGVPLRIDGDTVGFVFVSMPINSLFTHLGSMLVTFLISAGTMMLVASVIIFFATKKLTKPLTEISNAARDFGAGDFSARVEVAGSDEIATLAQSFNGMADSLREFENTRRQFVANVSHELRTPMTTIGGYIDGILDNTIPPEREDYYLGVVSEEVKRLSRLTTSLLDITRFEEGVYVSEIRNCNVWDVILTVMSSLERRISEKKIAVPDLDVTPRWVRCDIDMLHQVVYNLMDNAIKFTPEGGTITVTAETSGSQTMITVHNTGAGIRPEELTHIFERFYKADKSRSLDRTGTGLGLYIVKTMTQRMDGDVTARSEFGSWAEFSVALPVGTPEKKEQREAKGKGNTQEIPKVDNDGGKGGKTASWFKKWGNNLK